jgi:hypothetical protein
MYKLRLVKFDCEEEVWVESDFLPRSTRPLPTPYSQGVHS